MSTEITKEEFDRYCKVQREGRFNMFDPNARRLTGLDKKTYIAIIEQYSQLVEKYGDQE